MRVELGVGCDLEQLCGTGHDDGVRNAAAMATAAAPTKTGTRDFAGGRPGAVCSSPVPMPSSISVTSSRRAARRSTLDSETSRRGSHQAQKFPVCLVDARSLPKPYHRQNSARPRTCAYVERRAAEGKTRREILRCHYTGLARASIPLDTTRAPAVAPFFSAGKTADRVGEYSPNTRCSTDQVRSFR